MKNEKNEMKKERGKTEKMRNQFGWLKENTGN